MLGQKPKRLITLFLIAFFLLPLPARSESLPPCFLYDAGIDTKQALRRHTPFARAFRLYQKRRWKEADKAFTKEMNEITRLAIRIFQPKTGEEVSNELAQKFLKKHVLRKHPSVLVGDNDFRFAPEISLAVAEARCKIGNARGAIDALRTVKRNDHLHVPLARAVVALASGDPSVAMKEIADSMHNDQWQGRLVQARALTRLNRHADAARELEAASNRCLSLADCDLVEKVRQALSPQKSGETP